MVITPNLDEWNRQYIAFAQALLGVISQNFRMVWLDYGDESWLMHFVLESDDKIDREEIDEAVTQFEALQDRAIACKADVVVDPGSLDWPSPPARVIFCRREG